MLRSIFLIIICTILQSCANNFNTEEQKKITYYNNELLDKCSKSNQVVLVGGCFDVLHYGHLQFLRNAKSQGKYLIIALEPDQSIIKYKKRKPVHNQLQRAEILSHLAFVDQVVMLPELKGFEDYKKLVQNICPSIIAVTKNDPQISNKQAQAKSIGAKVVEVTDLIKNLEGENFSTTNIINNGFHKKTCKGSI